MRSLRPSLRAPLVSSLVTSLAVAFGDVGCHRGSTSTDANAADAAPPKAKLNLAPMASIRAIDIVRDLCNTVGSRLTGSANDAAAVEWATKKMKSFGLGYVRTDPVTVGHWERGAESAEIVGATKTPLAIAALGGSVGTPPEGVEAEILEVSSLDDLSKLTHAQVAGKIVFVNVYMRATRDGSGYGVAVPARVAGASIAARLGAVAYLVRSIGTGVDDHPHTGAMRYADDAPKIPAAALSAVAAEKLHTLSIAGTKVRVSLHLGAQQLAETTSANVIGEITGVSAPTEIVLLGAHLDSWDLGPGAQDDGAGIAIVLETMRELAATHVPMRRTVRGVLFANEENGTRGARAYFDTHSKELGSHIFALEADEGSGRVWGVTWWGDTNDKNLFNALAGPLTAHGVETPVRADAGGTDIDFLRAAGVPILALTQDMTKYFDIHHSAADTIDAIDASTLDQVVSMWVPFVRGLANTGELPQRIPMPDRKERVRGAPPPSASAYPMYPFAPPRKVPPPAPKH